ncbi:T9SS type A sorting domain-containing protein [Fulvivirgaceae bacterium LMO-SS25]
MIKTSTNCCKYLVFAVLFLLVLGFNHTVNAQTATAPAAGDGSSGNPYQIATLQNLYWIAATDVVVASPNRTTRQSYHFIQTANIDASATISWFAGEGWLPINNFTGVYNGDGYVISDLFINRPLTSGIGLFNSLDGGTLENLGVVDVNITGQDVVGGLLGSGYTGAIVSECFATGSIVGRTRVGGFVGFANVITISNTYARVSITASGSHAGGLVGQLWSSVVNNSYATGSVGGAATNQGGLIGNIVSSGTIVNSFYDSEASGQSDDTGKGVPKTTAEMKTLATFTTDLGVDAWDFTSTWAMCGIGLNNGYPYLQSLMGEIASVAPTVGDGTLGTPYQIATLANLKWISEDESRWASHYVQTANIDASSTAYWNCGAGWSPIGKATTVPFSATSFSNRPFTGTYNGGDYTISGLTINRPTLNYVGLFGLVSGSSSSINRISLTNANVIGFRYVGSLIGLSLNAQIAWVSTSGSVRGVGDFNSRDVGGIVGFMRGTTLSNSFSLSSVLGGNGGFTGGIVGYMDAAPSGAAGTSSISNSFSSGTVSSSSSWVGGIAGYFEQSVLENSYSTGNVSGSQFVGGAIGGLLSGSSSTNSYSVGLVSGSSLVGGFIGSRSGTVTNSFYDSETSGRSDTGKGVAKTTAQMKSLATFTTDITPNDWNFTATTGIWQIQESAGGYISYPYLQSFNYDTPGSGSTVNPIPGLVIAAPTSYTWSGGTGDGSVGSNWDNGMPPVGADIIIPESATPYPVFNANMELGNITIEPNATLTMAPSFRLDITEDSNITIGAGGKLILKSDGTGTAYIGSLTGTSTITGTVLQERYLMGSNRSFRFMGHPFNTAIPLSALGDQIDITGSGTGFTPTATNNPSAFYYDPSTGDADTEEDGGWQAFTSMTDNWNRYQGIRVLVRGSKGQSGSFEDVEYTPDPVTFEWEGEVNTGTQTINLTSASPSGGLSDFNLIGNPYPSAIDLKAITRSVSVGANFYIWQPRESTSGTAGRGGAYLTEPFATGDPTYTLPTGGAFFVRAGAAAQTLTIEEADKVNSNEPLQSVAGSTLRMDAEQASKYGSNSIQMVLSSEGEWWDRSLVFFNAAGANTSQDAEDATKLANPEVNLFTVSADDFAMAIDARPYQESEGVETNINRIPLHILSPARAYTLSLPDFDLEEGRTLRLYDRFTEEYITLAKGTTYDFEVTDDPSSKGYRFDIVMGIEVITSIHPSNNRFQAYLLPNPAQEQVRISIQKPDNVATTNIRIVSMTGVEVSNEKLTTDTSELDINLSQLSKGIYLVEITHGTERIVKRLIVN